MNGIVLGLSGRIASGKSTVAKATAIALRCSHVSFGAYVRWRAKEGGYDDDRKTLQDLGRDLLRERRAQNFCIDVLKWGAPEFVPGMDLVVEGIRHVEVADALRLLVYPSRFALVFLRVDERIRQNRFELRGGEDRGELRTADEHDTEKDVGGRLRGLAALTLVSTRPSGELVRTIRKWVSEERLLWRETESR